MELLGITLAYSAKKTEGTGRWRLNWFKAISAAPLVVLTYALYVRKEIKTATKLEK